MYLNSIQGHIDVLKSHWEEFSVALADSGQLKSLIDGFSMIATILTKMTNTIGGIGMIATPLMAMASKTSNMGLFKTYDKPIYDANGKFTGESEQSWGWFSTANKAKAELEVEQAKFGRGGKEGIVAINQTTAALQEYSKTAQAAGGSLITVEEAQKNYNQAVKKGVGVIDAEKELKQAVERESALNTTLGKAYEKVDKAHIDHLRNIAQESIRAGESEEQLARRFAEANAAYLGAEDVKAQQKQKGGRFANIAKSTGAMFGNIAATMAMSALIEGAMAGFDYFNKQKRLTSGAKVSAMKDSINEYNNAISESKDATKTIEGLSSEFNVLSKGVDESGHNVSLTATEFERYKEIVQELTSISPSLVQGYNAEGDAIINRNTAIEDALKLQQQYADLASETYFSDDTFEKIYEGAQVNMKKAANEMRSSLIEGTDATLADITSERQLRQLQIDQEQAAPKVDEQMISAALERQVDLQSASAAELRQIVKERERILSYANEQMNADGKLTEAEKARYDELESYLNQAATQMGNFDAEMQPVVDWLQQSMSQVNAETGESVMSQIPEAMRDSYVEGLRQIVAEGGDDKVLRDKAVDLGNYMTSELGPGSEYEKVMQEAQKIKDDFMSGDRTQSEAKKTTKQLEEQSAELRDLAKDYYEAGEAENDQIKSAIGAMLTQESINLDNFATDNVLDLAEAFNPLSDAISEARTAKEKFDASMEGGDYDTGIKGFKEIYESVMDDYNNAGYGTQAFWNAAEQTLGRETLRDLDYDIDAVNKRMKSMKTLIDENAEGTKAFDDLLMDHREAINNLGGQSQVFEDGSWDIRSDEIHAVATELGMADDMLVSLIDNARHWQKVDLSDDPGDIRKAINDMEGTKQYGDKTYQWLDKVEDAARQAGLNVGEMKDRIDEMDNVKLLNFDQFRGDSEDVAQIAKQIWNMNDALKVVGEDGKTRMSATGFIAQMKGMGRTADETTTALQAMKDEGLLDLDGIDLSEYEGGLSGLVKEVFGSIEADDPFMKMTASVDSLKDSINSLIYTMGGIPEDWLHIDSQLAGIDEIIAKGNELTKDDYQQGAIDLEKEYNKQQEIRKKAKTQEDKDAADENMRQVQRKQRQLDRAAHKAGVLNGEDYYEALEAHNVSGDRINKERAKDLAAEEAAWDKAAAGAGKYTDAIEASKRAGDAFGSGGRLDQEFDNMYQAAERSGRSMYEWIDSLNLGERQTKRLKRAVDEYLTATGKSTKATKKDTQAQQDNMSAKQRRKRVSKDVDSATTAASDTAKSAIDSVGEATSALLKVNVDDSEVDDTEEKVDDLDGKDVDVNIKAKTRGLDKALKKVEGLSDDSRNQVIMASIEYQKTGDLSGLQDAINSIADEDVRIQVAADVADAMGGMQAVDGMLSILDGTTAKPTLSATDKATPKINSAQGALSAFDGSSASATISASLSATFWGTINAAKNAIASVVSALGQLSLGTSNRRVPALYTGTPNRRRIAGSAARGGRLGPHGHGGLTLTGELGPELVWLPDEDRSFLTGIRGPEMQDLPGNAVVWPYEETKRIFGNTVPPGFLTNRYSWTSEQLKSIMSGGSAARGVNFGSMASSGPGTLRYPNSGSKNSGGGGGNGGGNNGGNNNNNSNKGRSRRSSKSKKGKYTPWSEFIEYQDWMLDMEYYDEEEYEKKIKKRYRKYRKKVRKWRRKGVMSKKEMKKEIREAKKDLHDALIATYEGYVDELDHALTMGDITEEEYWKKIKAKGAKLYSKGGRGNKPKRGYAKEFREWQEQVQDAADDAYDAFIDSIDHNLEIGVVSVDVTDAGAEAAQAAADKGYSSALKKLKKAKKQLKKAKNKLKKKKNKKNRNAVTKAREDVTAAQQAADQAWYDLQIANRDADAKTSTSYQAYTAVDYYNDIMDWYNESGTARTAAGKKVDEAEDNKTAADKKLEKAKKKRKKAKKKYKKSGNAKDHKKLKQAKKNVKDAKAEVNNANARLENIRELTADLDLETSVEHLNLADMSDEQIKEFYENLKDARQEAYDYLSDISERTLANSMPGDWDSLSNYIAETTKNLEMLDESLGDGDKIIEARQDIVDSLFDNLNDKLDDTLDLIKLFGMSHAQSWDSVMKVIDQGIDFWNKNYKQISTNTDAVKQYYDWLKQAIDALQDFYSDLEGQMSDVTDLVERMIRQEMDDMIDALDKQRDKYDEIIEKKKESLQLTEDELDYQDELADYAKREAKLRTQIAALSKDDSRAAKSRRAELESELDELLTEKNKTVRQETLSRTQDSLDKQSEQYGQQITQITDYMQALLDNQSIINKAVYENIGNLETNDLLKRLVDYNDVHGDAMMSTIQEWAADLNDVIAGTADQSGIDIASFTENVNKQLDTVMKEHANASIAGNQDASMTEAGLITNAMRNASNQIAGILNLNPGQVADAFGLWLGSGQTNNVSSAIFTMQTTLGTAIQTTASFLAAAVVDHANQINPELQKLLAYVQEIARYKYVPGEAYDGSATYEPRTVESVTRDLNQAQSAKDILQKGLYNANGESYETLIAQKEAELKQKEVDLKQAEKTYQNKQTAFESAKAAYQNKKTDSNKNKRDKAKEARNNAEAARDAAKAARDAIKNELDNLIAARDTALETARKQNGTLDKAMNTYSDLFATEQNQAGYQNNVDVAQARMDNKLMPKWNDAKTALEAARDAFKKAEEKKKAHPNSKKVAKAYEKAKAAKQAAKDAFDKIDAKKTKLQAEIDSGTANITAIDEVINGFNIDDLLKELEELKAELQDIDLDKDIDYHHGGLATGFAGKGANLKQKEVLSVLTDDELVLNRNDQMRLGMQLQMLSDMQSSLNKMSMPDSGIFNGGAIELSVNAPVTINGNATADTISELNKFGDHIADVTLSRLQNAMRLNGVRTSASSSSRKFN